jgi:hypothetical protein
MKTLKLTVLGLGLLLSGTAIAQKGDPNMSDNWVTSDFEKTELNNGKGDRYFVKQFVVTEVYTPVMLNPADKYKLNQEIIYMPAQVTKKIRLDNDPDAAYDSFVEFNYAKPVKGDVNFTLTNEGIVINAEDSSVSVNKITDKTSVMHKDVNNIMKEGNYTLTLSNGEVIDVKVSNYSKM